VAQDNSPNAVENGGGELGKGRTIEGVNLINVQYVHI
jgi:hypothetical protein